jgi:hypothetical protein
MHVKSKGIPYEDDMGEEARGNLLLLFELDLPSIIPTDDQFQNYLATYFHR